MRALCYAKNYSYVDNNLFSRVACLFQRSRLETDRGACGFIQLHCYNMHPINMTKGNNVQKTLYEYVINFE